MSDRDELDNVEQPGEQAFADQVRAATQEISHLAVHVHEALHARDAAKVDELSRAMYARLEAMHPALVLNLVISMASMAVTIGHGDDCKGLAGGARVVRRP